MHHLWGRAKSIRKEKKKKTIKEFSSWNVVVGDHVSEFSWLKVKTLPVQIFFFRVWWYFMTLFLGAFSFTPRRELVNSLRVREREVFLALLICVYSNEWTKNAHDVIFRDARDRVTHLKLTFSRIKAHVGWLGWNLIFWANSASFFDEA